MTLDEIVTNAMYIEMSEMGMDVDRRTDDEIWMDEHSQDEYQGWEEFE